EPGSTPNKSETVSGWEFSLLLFFGFPWRSWRLGGYLKTIRRYFGTDGVRGKVGDEPITPDFVMRLGYAAGKVLAGIRRKGVERPAVLIGKDTRISGYMLESALEAGLSAAGVDVVLVGPRPTAAAAYLTARLRP